ncbi:unnamed protein product, partial [Dovyalis caffra]
SARDGPCISPAMPQPDASMCGGLRISPSIAYASCPLHTYTPFFSPTHSPVASSHHAHAL